MTEVTEHTHTHILFCNIFHLMWGCARLHCGSCLQRYKKKHILEINQVSGSHLGQTQ